MADAGVVVTVGGLVDCFSGDDGDTFSAKIKGKDKNTYTKEANTYSIRIVATPDFPVTSLDIFWKDLNRQSKYKGPCS